MPLLPRSRGLRNRRRRITAVTVSIAAALTFVALLIAGAQAPRRSTPSSTAASPMTAPSLPSTPPPTTTPSPRVWPLAAMLDPVWADTPGGCLRATARGRVLYEVNPGAAVAPASVTKLFTAAAALRVLGPDRRFRTTVRSVSPPVQGVVAGDLWLVGGGDPVLGTDAWAAQLSADLRLYTSLDQLADRVVAAGVRRIDGRVLGDESRFDADRYVDTWPNRLIADGEVGPLSALTVNDGFGTSGHPSVPFSDPPADAARLLVELLAGRGVTIAGAAGAGVAPVASVEVAGIDSAAAAELVHAMLRDSDNGTAELLVKELGRQRRGAGTTAAGTDVITETLAAAGVGLDGVIVADGSGLSDAARLTCRSLTTLLANETEAFTGRLSVAGRDGTLARRFLGTAAAGRLRAKTGTLDGTAGLAGYVDTVDGTTVEFAYIINGLAAGEPGRALQDRLGAALATATPTEVRVNWRRGARR